MQNKTTQKLLNILNKIEDESQLKEYVKASLVEENKYNLSQYILNLCNSKGFDKSDIIRNADIYRTYGYEILNGKKSPSRDKLLKICIGNNFTLDETNRTLTLAKLGVLYAKDPRDSILVFSINNKIDLINTNIILDEHGFPLLS